MSIMHIIKQNFSYSNASMLITIYSMEHQFINVPSFSSKNVDIIHKEVGKIPPDRIMLYLAVRKFRPRKQHFLKSEDIQIE